MSAAVADAEMRTQEEVAAASAAMKAAAEAQQLRELEDKVDALQQQLASTTDAQLAAQAALTCAPASSRRRHMLAPLLILSPA